MSLASVSPRPTPRRRFLKALAVAASSALAARGARQVEDRDSFVFATVADLHHANEDCDPWFEKLFREIEQSGADFCLVLGDLAHAGEDNSIKTIKSVAAAAGVSIYPVPGNHDCDLFDDTRVYRRTFPSRLNYHFTRQGWQFIGLDSTAGKAWGDVHASDETLVWLRQACRRLSTDLPTVLFTHFPLHASVPNTLVNGQSVLDITRRLNLKMTLSGHHHGATENTFPPAELFTQPCASRVSRNHDGTPDKGYYLFSCHRQGTWHQRFVKFSG